MWKANEKKSRNRKREKKRWSKQESKEKSLSKLRNKILHKTVGRKQFMKAKIHTLSITFLMAFWFVITFICADNFLTYTLLSYLQTIKHFRWRKVKYDLSEITLLSWQREYLTTFFVFRNPKYLCNVLCEPFCIWKLLIKCFSNLYLVLTGPITLFRLMVVVFLSLFGISFAETGFWKLLYMFGRDRHKLRDCIDY